MLQYFQRKVPLLFFPQLPNTFILFHIEISAYRFSLISAILTNTVLGLEPTSQPSAIFCQLDVFSQLLTKSKPQLPHLRLAIKMPISKVCHKDEIKKTQCPIPSKAHMVSILDYHYLCSGPPGSVTLLCLNLSLYSNNGTFPYTALGARGWRLRTQRRSGF